jgi:hypothetical protein
LATESWGKEACCGSSIHSASFGSTPKKPRRSIRFRRAISRYGYWKPLEDVHLACKNMLGVSVFWESINFNVQGDGLTMGGLLIVNKGNGGVAYAYAEERFGDHADNETVLKVCSSLK